MRSARGGITSEYSAEVCLLVSSTYYCCNLVLYAAIAFAACSPGEIRQTRTLYSLVRFAAVYSASKPLLAVPADVSDSADEPRRGGMSSSVSES